MRRIVAIVVFVALCVPVFSLAQTSVSDLQARINTLLQQIKTLQDQITALQGDPSSETLALTASSVAVGCPALSRSLTVGARGDDVSALQRFLTSQGVFDEEATGYFGPITEAAVQRLQAANSVVSSGTAATTGYGAVGPQTRALIARLCNDASNASTAATAVRQCPAIASVTAPSEICNGTWERLVSLGCHVGWRCTLSPSSGNKPPVISSIDGPSTLALGVFGQWTIQATDPELGALSYSVTWGDEGVEDILQSLAGLGGTYVSSPSISHAYAKTGSYTVSVNVRDSAGNVSSATRTVIVSATASAGTAYEVFLPAIATTTVKASCVTPWGTQIVQHLGTAAWQPFFTNGLYFSGTSTPIMRCENGGWLKCDTAGAQCQAFTVATSTQSSSAALPSYTGIIGQPCSKNGATMVVSVPPGTQLCQWLSCTVAQEVQTVTLTCQHSGWSDTSPFR